MSISRNRIKIIQSLRHKKYRQKYNFFVAEGPNIAREQSNQSKPKYRLLEAYYRDDQYAQLFPADRSSLINDTVLTKASLQQSPSDCIMLFELPKNDFKYTISGLTFYLDGIQNPGNLGAIMRIANWFGVDTIIRSPDSVDFYNPKVIQASMGAFLSTNLITANFDDIKSDDYEICALDMSGQSIYDWAPAARSIVIIGNEGQGVSDRLMQKADQLISIPSSNSHKTIDSLNAAVSIGILASQWQQKPLKQ